MTVTMTSDHAPNITRLPTPVPPSLTYPDDYGDYRGQSTPLIIDNGSTHLRWGFCSAPKPSCGLNVIAKYKERKYNKPLLLFGEAIEAESGAKGQAKTPWEGDVLLNFDALVRVPIEPVCM
jgi:actin-related protein 5